MTQKVIKIPKFVEVHMNYDTKRRDKLSWCQVPLEPNSQGIMDMIDLDDDGRLAMQYFGVYMRIVQIAAQAPKDCRDGVVRTTRGALSIKRLAHMLFLSHDFLNEAIEALCRVGWLEVTEVYELSTDESDGAYQLKSTDQPPPVLETFPKRAANVSKTSEKRPTLHNSTEQDITEQENTEQEKCAATPPAEAEEVGETSESVESEFVSQKGSTFRWVKGTGWIGVTSHLVKMWKAANPDKDIGQELIGAHAWLVSNPHRANKKHWARFFNGWLQDTYERFNNEQRQSNGHTTTGRGNSQTARNQAGGGRENQEGGYVEGLEATLL